MIKNFLQFRTSSGVQLEETRKKIFCFIAEVLFQLRLASLQAHNLRVSLEGDLGCSGALKGLVVLVCGIWDALGALDGLIELAGGLYGPKGFQKCEKI